MSRRTCSPWTTEEEDLIRRHYPALGAAGMHERGMLTYRSHNAIRVHACGMGLRLNEEAYAAMQRDRLLAIGESKRLGMMIDPPPEEISRRCEEIRKTWPDPPRRFEGQPKTGTVRTR